MLTQKDIDWLIDSMKRFFPTREESMQKFDQVMEKLDKFVGEIQTKRQEQIMHQGNHDRVDNRLERLEKKVNLPPFVD